MGKKHLKHYSDQLLVTIEQKLIDLLKQQNDAETIHELRVSVRRITPVLELLITLEEDSKGKKLLRQHQRVFRSLFKLLSAPRDLEVQIKLAYSFIEQFRGHESFLKQYIQQLEQKKQHLDEQLITSVASLWVSKSIVFLGQKDRFNRATKKALLLQLQANDVFHRQALKSSIKQLKIDPEHFHQTRVQLKKFRYFLEVRAVASQIQDGRLKTLKYIQDHLGNTNDLHNALRLLAQNNATQALLTEVDALYQEQLKGSLATIFGNKKSLYAKYC